MRTLLLALAVLVLPVAGFAGGGRSDKDKGDAKEPITKQAGTSFWSRHFKQGLWRGTAPAAPTSPKSRRADPPSQAQEPPPYAKPGAFVRTPPTTYGPGTPQTYTGGGSGHGISQDDSKAVAIDGRGLGVREGAPIKLPTPTPASGGAASGKNAITPGSGDTNTCIGPGACNGRDAGAH